MTTDPWPQVSLGELLRVKHGFAFKGEYFRSAGEALVLTPGNFRIGGGLQLREGKERYYAADYADEFRLQPGDLLIAMTDLTQQSPILGSPLVVPGEGTYLHNQRLGKVEILDRTRLDPDFAYFLFVSDVIRSQLRGSATGSTVRHTAPGRIYSATFHLPPIACQIKIGGILSAYDALIENNSRRIKILEEMAQRIYHEWFVDFRYPGHETVPLVESELGPIPDGWIARELGSATTVVLGGTPSRANAGYWANGCVPWINSGTVNKLRVLEPTALITEEALANCSAKMMPRGTTLIAITGATLGQVSYLEIRACANQSVVGVYDETGSHNEYIYLAIQHAIQRIIGAASGGAQQHINQNVVRNTQILFPPDDLLSQFTSLVKPTFEDVVALMRAVRSLDASRDLLLPRLISGEIDVEDLDIEVPDLAA